MVLKNFNMNTSLQTVHSSNNVDTVVVILLIATMVLCARFQDSLLSVSVRRVHVLYSTAGFKGRGKPCRKIRETVAMRVGIQKCFAGGFSLIVQGVSHCDTRPNVRAHNHEHSDHKRHACANVCVCLYGSFSA